MRAHVRACRNVPLFLALLAATAVGQTQTQKPRTYPTLPSETPAAFDPVATSFDYVRRDVMIPMRDGVRLRTIILVPKGAAKAPILLTRTPYDAESLTSHSRSAHLARSSTDTTTRPTSSCMAGTSAPSRTSVASTGPRETT